MKSQQIILRASSKGHCWTAEIIDLDATHADPILAPLPFSHTTPKQVVYSHIRAGFPHATIFTSVAHA